MDPEPLLRYFEYHHLPPHLKRVAYVFTIAAQTVCQMVPRSPERTVALRKLLEAKDAAVRASLTDAD